MSNVRFALIVPAAGSGQRSGADLPKPFLKIAGKTILEHSVSQFTGLPGLVQIVIATSGDYLEMTRDLFEPLNRHIRVDVVAGGQERKQSVERALHIVDESAGYIAIHDAVRPFVREEDISNCLDMAIETDAAILGFPVRDTIKKVSQDGDILETPDRTTLWVAQTPQIFERTLIQKAYMHAGDQRQSATDDSSLVERLGAPVHMVRGSIENFKITWPIDLKVARLLLER